MSRFNCMCPVCGHMNKEVDLVETDGEMECEQCRVLITVWKPYMDFEFSEKERMQLRQIAISSKNPSGKILHVSVDPSAKQKELKPDKVAV
ncbi:MAG: hypothetical protein Q4B26_20575 [Eubacteriales bacterium]|nr:hypothetical protein [Eubacteriales bacterium]